MIRHLALAFTALLAFSQDSPLRGRVIHVADGDTLTVLDATQASWRVRLEGIDAPEKGQPWGKVSGQMLRDLTAGDEVVVLWHKRDRYKRLIGVVLVDGQDAGLSQVASGMAWHYLDYEKEQTPEDRVRYAEAERAARAAKLGLWRDPDPVPPWTWRRRERSLAR